MRILLLAGASALAVSMPAYAQQGEDVSTTQPSGTPIDSLEPTDASSDPASAAPMSTGDVILDRLNALEARVKQLEARNAELEQQAELNQTRLQSVETKAAKAAQFTWAPTISEPTGQFTFKPRGVVEADGAAFVEREGGSHRQEQGNGGERPAAPAARGGAPRGF